MPQLVPFYFINQVLFDILSYNLFISTLRINRTYLANDNISYFLIYVLRLNIVFMKRSHDDFTSEDNDKDKTPTNEKISDDGSTPTEGLSDEDTSDEEASDAQETLGAVKRALNGEDIGKTSLDNIKEEFKSIFEDHIGDTKGALKEVKDELEGELSSLGKKSLTGLTEALEDISNKSSNKPLEEHTSKRAKTGEASEYSESDSITNNDSSNNTRGDSEEGILESIFKLFE